MEFKVVEYGKVEQRPDRAALATLVHALQGPVEALVRKDAAFKALGLVASDYVDNAEAVIEVLSEHIELLQRPVLVRGGVAMIGRPKESVALFLE